MRKIYYSFIISCILLTGCKSQNIESDKQKNWSLDAQYDVIHNGWTYAKYMEKTEDGILSYLPAFQSGEMGIPYLPSYVNDDQINLLDKDTSSSCSFQDPSKCKNTFLGQVIHYYKGKIYYIDSRYNSSTNQLYGAIMQSDIDGNNQKELFRFPEESVETKTAYSNFMQFHRDHIYVLYLGDFYMGNIDTMDLEVLSKQIQGVSSAYFYGDTMILCADEYDDGTSVHYEVTLECDLLGNVKQLLYENLNTKFIDETNIFYFGENREIIMQNRNSKETKKILDQSCVYFFKNEDTYLLDTSLAAPTLQLTVLDQNGDVVAQRNFDRPSTHTPQIYTNDRLYVIQDEWIGYYEINDQKISDLKMLDKP